MRLGNMRKIEFSMFPGFSEAGIGGWHGQQLDSNTLRTPDGQ